MEPVALESILESRDARASRQKEIIREYPGCSVVCLTVVMPGPVKRNGQSLVAAAAAVEAIRETFSDKIVFSEERDLPTGYEAYFAVKMTSSDAKRTACRIENGHPLGRIFDIDVIDSEGVPLSREAVGEEPRKCLVCGKPARICMRSHVHTHQALLDRIDALVHDYKTGVACTMVSK